MSGHTAAWRSEYSSSSSGRTCSRKQYRFMVGFPPGSVLVQLAGSSPTGGRAYKKLLIHAATTSLTAAQADSSRTNLDATQRLIYVGGQSIQIGRASCRERV